MAVVDREAHDGDGRRSTACHHHNSDAGCRAGPKCRFPHTRLCYYYHTPGLCCFNRERCLFIHEHDAEDLCQCTLPACRRFALRSEGAVCRTCRADGRTARPPQEAPEGRREADPAPAKKKAEQPHAGRKKKAKKKPVRRTCETPSCRETPASRRRYCRACWQEVRGYLV